MRLCLEAFNRRAILVVTPTEDYVDEVEDERQGFKLAIRI